MILDSTRMPRDINKIYATAMPMVDSAPARNASKTNSIIATNATQKSPTWRITRYLTCPLVLGSHLNH